MNGPLRRLGTVVGAMFALLLVAATYVQFVDAGDLQADGRNSRTFYAELGRARGPITVGDQPIAESVEVDDRYSYQRTYPDGPTYAHVTGAYSVVYGASGLEAAEEELLSGTDDSLFYRRLSDLLTGREPAGAVVETSIVPEVQQAAAEALGGQRGAAVALDPRTGEVLALVSSPSYDPNALAGHDTGAVRAAREELLADEARPLENRAIASFLYPPGSVFKLVTAAAALQAGYAPDSALAGPAVLDLPQTEQGLRNSDRAACGPNDQTTLADALRTSCNTAFASVGMALGEGALRDAAAGFGFGEELAIPLEVTPSTVPTGMDAPSLAQAAIGQRNVRVTPLQVAMVSAGIANDGVVMAPTLVRSVRGEDLEVIRAPSPTELGRALSAEDAEALTQMMVGVVADGTGRAARIDGVEVAGKTGTAQHEPGRPPHAWFTAFAPADDPVVAVAVVVEDGGDAGDQASGGRTAAPVAREMIQAQLDRVAQDAAAQGDG
ncbi:MAG: Cell division protein FtsI [Peptidoglycan synthetase] [uncultured Quadrisphaera sp.]|uniref:Cell division protein FtsI [Peptidoglycan synthetase] n=1 Tax=uncultured Quadrisphaera sp. TaxID=904978 RepID=A0A6J4Q8B3_9ACTN|nr:MAG: Cell division protein FtsI [Peptidoglycan synthetase] [uncultured Quadrisphaera sp.]